MPQTPDWLPPLAPGERLLWQDRPEPSVIWRDLLKFETFFGVIFLGFSLFWTFGVAFMLSGVSGGGLFSVFPLFGLPFILAGLYLVVGRLFYDAYLRRNTWYTLTNQAAYIATTAFGKRGLQRYDRNDMSPPELEGDQPGTVWFARELHNVRRRRHGRSRHGARVTQAYETKIGFRRIDDARAVYRMLG